MFSPSLDTTILRDFWCTKWRMKGHFTMPYAYLADRNLTDNFWMISRGERMKKIELGLLS
jgi:hypothetical protein